MDGPIGHRHFLWMFLFAGLFGLRVLAQLIQAIHPVSFLPPFRAWHGAVLPYPVLVALHVGVMVVVVNVLWRVRTDTISPRPWKYRLCFILGGIYFAGMAFRLFAGLTFLAGHPWFSKSIPAFFHVVLASFIVTLGHYLYRKATTSLSFSNGFGTVREGQGD